MTLPKKLLVSLSIPGVFFPGLILAALLGWDWPRDLSRLAQSGGFKESRFIFPSQGRVERIIDGDTLELITGQTVRLIGLQAPERGEPLYLEAKQFLEKLVFDQTLSLEYEPVDKIDKYGRLVAYVYLNEKMVNEASLKIGLARYLTYPHYRKFRHHDQLVAAQKFAQAQKLNLWSLPPPPPPD